MTENGTANHSAPLPLSRCNYPQGTTPLQTKEIANLTAHVKDLDSTVTKVQKRNTLLILVVASLLGIRGLELVPGLLAHESPIYITPNIMTAPDGTRTTNTAPTPPAPTPPPSRHPRLEGPTLEGPTLEGPTL